MHNYNTFCNNSILYLQYVELLKNKEIKYVSFDIFETLLFRAVHKNTIFSNMIKDPLVKKSYDRGEHFIELRLEAEREARRLSNEEEIDLDLIYSTLCLSRSEQEYFKKLEVEEENKNLYLNKEILEWIILAYKYGKKVIFISDMYLKKNDLKNILNSHLASDIKYELFLSSDLKFTKRKGTLFKYVMNHLKLKNRDFFHIGDNFISDYQVPKDMNIESIYYNLGQENLENLSIEEQYNNFSYNQGNSYRTQASLLNPYPDDMEKFFFNLGAVYFGPILFTFTKWMQNIIEENNIQQINLLMREGRIFKRYLEPYLKDKEINLIYSSRKASFLPNLDSDFFEKEFSFSDFKFYTVDEFYLLFQIEISDENIKTIQNKVFNQVSDKMTRVILEDIKANKKNILKNKLEQKEYLKNYLDNIVTKDSFLFDFGGSGTLLNNLKHLSSHPFKLMGLFYINSSGIKNMINENIYSFFTYSKSNSHYIETIKRTPYFLEILFNGLNGSTLKYNLKDSRVCPELNMLDNTLSKKSSAFDTGIDAFFAVMDEYSFSKDIYPRDFLLRILCRIIEIPSYSEVEFLSKLRQDIRNGSEHFRELITEKEIIEVKEKGLSDFFLELSKNINFRQEEILWPQGVISSINSEYIKDIKGYNSLSSNQLMIEKIIRKIVKNKIEDVYIYGAGELGKELILRLCEYPIKIIAVLDTMASYADVKIFGYTIISLDEIELKDNENIIIASNAFYNDMKDNLFKYEEKNNVKINLLN